MSSRTSVLKGVVRGRIIELEGEPGLPDGQPVTVTVQAVETQPTAGQGLRLSAGTWVDDAAGLEEFLDWNRRRRKATREGNEA